MDSYQRNAVVLDCGSCYVKAGFAGEICPVVFRPTVRPETTASCAPIRSGFVQDWDALERLCIDVIYKQVF